MLKKVLIPLIIVGAIVIWGISVNNSLINKEENVKQSWAQVENQYQRRADLVPNLVETVKGAADFEQETLTQVIEARSRATSVNVNPDNLNSQAAIQKFQDAQNQLGSALSRLLVTVERYPELKANSNFRDLQNQLEGTENRISVARNRFNQAVQGYNTDLRQFPNSLIAGLSGFDQMAYFEADKGAEEAPAVSFD